MGARKKAFILLGAYHAPGLFANKKCSYDLVGPRGKNPQLIHIDYYTGLKSHEDFFAKFESPDNLENVNDQPNSFWRINLIIIPSVFGQHWLTMWLLKLFDSLEFRFCAQLIHRLLTDSVDSRAIRYGRFE